MSKERNSPASWLEWPMVNTAPVLSVGIVIEGYTGPESILPKGGECGKRRSCGEVLLFCRLLGHRVRGRCGLHANVIKWGGSGFWRLAVRPVERTKNYCFHLDRSR